MDTKETLFIAVLLPLNLHRLFSYRVPMDLNEEIVVGKRVSVPFGRNKIYAGIIAEISTVPPQRYEAKYIHDVIDDQPIVTEWQLAFWQWMAHYYQCSIGSVLNAALPAGLKMEGESKVLLHPDFSWEDNLWDEKEKQLLELLENHIELTVSNLTALSKTTSIHRYIKSLYLKGAILIKEDAKQSFKPKLETYLQIPMALRDDQALQLLFDQLQSRASKQLEALMRFIAKVGIEGEMSLKQLGDQLGGRNAIKALITKGVFSAEKREVSRLSAMHSIDQSLQLSKVQQLALTKIEQAFAEDKTALLHGVTSSGKTLLYTQLIQACLERGEQVLYLLPEIALTSQLLDRLAAYFGEQMVVSHSKFSNNERVEVYYKIRSGKALLILGTRSAIFHPFENLSLIIVDEEHESSFKQHEPAPRFHARDTALYLGKRLKAHVLLGSATPSYESYSNAQEGKFALVELTERHDQAILPAIHLVDMLVEKKRKLNRGIFSSTLMEAILQAKKDEKQTILFQNKKGYVPVLECTQCSWTPHCINCDISLTYYKFQNNLRCHYCGYTRPPVNQCAQCGHNGLELIGYGTERIEDEIKLFAPELKVQRLDQNTTRRKTSHKKIIDAFGKGEIDVLIGTQMIAKGLDFDNVRVVGIVNADHLLNFPDFRAHERAFQLMTQVAGRAGRRSEQGMVYIQSGKVDHPVLQHIVENDYKGLYDNELTERQLFNYPPYTRLIKIVLRHKDALQLHKCTAEARHRFSRSFGKNILGPEKPHVGKIRNWYLMQFLLKMDNNIQQINAFKRQLRSEIDAMEQDRLFKGLRFTIDVDPV